MSVMVDFDFRREIEAFDISLNYCFQCGTCSGGCPVSYITKGEYNPRKIIEESLLGLKDRLIQKQDPNVWLCSTCQKCVELCPQKVQLTEIFNLIKNKCVLAGQFPEAFKQQALMIIEKSMAIPFTDAILRRRNKLEIPTLEMADEKEMKIELNETKLIEKIGYNGSKGE